MIQAFAIYAHLFNNKKAMILTPVNYWLNFSIVLYKSTD